MLCSLLDCLSDFSADSLSDFDLDFSSPELPLMLIRGVGSLIGSIYNLSNGTFSNICSLYD